VAFADSVTVFPETKVTVVFEGMPDPVTNSPISMPVFDVTVILELPLVVLAVVMTGTTCGARFVVS
jgi:hypothetical protein